MADVAAVEAGTHERVAQRIVFDSDTLRARIAALGDQITRAYPDGDLLVLASARGSIMFAADLVRAIRRPLRFDFLVSPPSGAGLLARGSTDLLYVPETTLRGTHIVMLVDVLESGFNAARLRTLVGAHSPRSLEMCVLLRKRVATGLNWPVRFVGFEAPGEFLVGYGLENAEHFRQLPYIAILE